jgi:hypothetical protein
MTSALTTAATLEMVCAVRGAAGANSTMSRKPKVNLFIVYLP